MFTLDEEEIKKKILNRDLTICIFGMGKIGLPMACAFVDAGFNVIGVDVDPKVVDNVNAGNTWFFEPELNEKLMRAVKNKKLSATLDGKEAVKKSDFILCIVPLFLNNSKKPDFSAVMNATETIYESLRSGHVVGYETTVPIGTTENLLKPMLEKSALKAGEDFGLFYSPERLMSGFVFSRLRELKKIVGGINEKSAFVAAELYKTICPAGVDIVKNPRTAEMIKLAAGIWRDVNIAFANEMAKVADKYDIDIMEVVEKVNSTPRRMMLEPGCGVGGHCIPVYPYFVISEFGDLAPLIKTAREVNESMPGYTVRLAEEKLRERGKKLEGANVVILGLAYRPYVREVANSPTLDMVKILIGKKARVSVFDPIYSRDEVEKIVGVESGEFEDLLRDADCVIISTMYEMFRDIRNKVKFDCVIIDGRNRLRDADKGIGR
ncbi:nucleotide sugar dehydrogenase [Candidatus Bathyarchaeota archaeon]|nr:nucleotide sugar dehydrogenase [Candidatus Bathyarchaeota archaeon]